MTIMVLSALLCTQEKGCSIWLALLSCLDLYAIVK